MLRAACDRAPNPSIAGEPDPTEIAKATDHAWCDGRFSLVSSLRNHAIPTCSSARIRLTDHPCSTRARTYASRLAKPSSANRAARRACQFCRWVRWPAAAAARSAAVRRVRRIPAASISRRTVLGRATQQDSLPLDLVQCRGVHALGKAHLISVDTLAMVAGVAADSMSPERWLRLDGR
jgi:hypothetical protein